ncbi:hypothetical protein IAI53_07260 [Thauera sp. CAU 1555]|uniref:Uncharacterized protein n=1 Tax=Thauera sedimentorum TaxID=2767595 RepID=A0ABR9B8J8_9RHOO|nr:hypothetical protein [Thauera sedimentorum]MBC9071762.1 hypothetical protein [Thauera sedimentorum]MBD8502681.1 hypothetical protein [Thauera sedimentorum]
MSVQRNVAEQNAETLSEIRHAGGLMAEGAIQWLPNILRSHNIEPSLGVLVRVASVTEQEGESYGCVWLTSSGQFWKIDAMISRENGEVIELESVDDISADIVVSSHLRGTGKSFGFLAHQVLREVLGG